MQNSQLQNKVPATPGIPNRSPMQVLSRPNCAWLRWSDENRYIHSGMVAGGRYFSITFCKASYHVTVMLSAPLIHFVRRKQAITAVAHWTFDHFKLPKFATFRYIRSTTATEALSVFHCSITQLSIFTHSGSNIAYCEPLVQFSRNYSVSGMRQHAARARYFK